MALLKMMIRELSNDNSEDLYRIEIENGEFKLNDKEIMNMFKIKKSFESKDDLFNEILASEKAYIVHLKSFMDFYIKPLKTPIDGIDFKDYLFIDVHFEKFILFHEYFLDKLVAKWNKTSGSAGVSSKEQRNKSVIKTFKKIIHAFFVNYAQYFACFETAANILEVETSEGLFKKRVDECFKKQQQNILLNTCPKASASYKMIEYIKMPYYRAYIYYMMLKTLLEQFNAKPELRRLTAEACYYFKELWTILNEIKKYNSDDGKNKKHFAYIDFFYQSNNNIADLFSTIQKAKTIMIRSKINNRILSAENFGYDPLTATDTYLQETDDEALKSFVENGSNKNQSYFNRNKFKLVYHDDGSVSFYVIGNGLFVSTKDPNLAKANKLEPGKNEKFLLIKNENDGSFIIKSLENGKSLQIRQWPSSQLCLDSNQANRDAELFNFIYTTSDEKVESFYLNFNYEEKAVTVRLRSKLNNKIVGSRDMGFGPLFCDQMKADDHTKMFKLFYHKDRTVSFYSLANRLFVGVDSEKKCLIANKLVPDVENLEKFILKQNLDGTYSIQSKSCGKFVRIKSVSVPILICNSDFVNVKESFYINYIL